jgi:TolA-binding protein
VFAEKINYFIGECYFEAKNYGEALNAYRRIIEEFPEGLFEKSAKLMVAKSLEKQEKYDDAISEYLRLLEVLEYEKTKPKKEKPVKKILKKIGPFPIDSKRFYPGIYLGLGNSYRGKKEYKRALIEYFKVATRYPQAKEEAAEANFFIGQIYDKVYKIRDYEKAIDAYNRVIKKYPKSIWAGEAKRRKKYIKDNYL